MNILYHHRTLGDGAEGIHIEEMIAAFRSQGHNVFVVSPVGEKTNATNKAFSLGLRIKSLLPRAAFEFLEVGYNLAGMLALWRLARRHGAGLIYDRYITFNASAVLLGKMLRIPVVLEVNAPLALERSQQPDEKLIFKSLAHRMERWICSNSYRTLVVSTPLKEYLVSVGVPEGKVSVVPNGANLDRFSGSSPEARGLRERCGIPGGAVVIGFTGIMRPWHGIDLLLEAFRKVCAEQETPLHLLLVGDGPIRADIEAAIRSSGLEGRVTITGRLPHQEVPRYVEIFDIAVSPKATFYASPMKILEYMALGKAVVAPDMRNITDIIVSGEDGVLFEPNSSASLADKLGGLTRDASLRQRIGNRGRQKTRDKLNWIQNAKTVVSWLGGR